MRNPLAVRFPKPLLALFVVAAAGTAVSVASARASAATAAEGILYVGARPGRLVILDEATFKPVAEVPLPTTAPGPSYFLQLSQDRRRFLSFSTSLEDIEVVDIASRKIVQTIRLSEGNKKVRFDGYVGGGETARFLALPARAYTKLVDRFEIGPKAIVEYDLEKKKLTGRTVPWPKGEERNRVVLRYSPDGKLLYVFAEDVFIYDVASLKLVDTWEISRPLEGGFGRVERGSVDEYWEEPGFSTGVFEVEDPVQHRKMMGIARMDLAGRKLDFWTVGPSRPLTGFSLAPGRKKAYGVTEEIGDYEIWTFDLEGRRLEKRTPFPGRPRMEVAVSSNGRILYVYGAGNTIDLFDAATHAFLRTVTLDFEFAYLYVFPPER